MKFVRKSFDAKVQNIKSRLKIFPTWLVELGEALNSSIARRVEKGEGLNGKMKPYSEGYKKYKGKKRHRQVNFRDLNLSGKMMASLGVKKTGEETVVLSFGGIEEQKKAQGNQKISPFFGISTPNEKRIVKDFLKQALDFRRTSLKL